MGFLKKKGRKKGAGDGCTVNAVVIFVRHVKGHQTGSAFFNGSLLSLSLSFFLKVLAKRNHRKVPARLKKKKKKGTPTRKKAPCIDERRIVQLFIRASSQQLGKKEEKEYYIYIQDRGATLLVYIHAIRSGPGPAGPFHPPDLIRAGRQ